MTAPLPRLHRPRADTIEISDLVEGARAGKYELPDFQRDLAWNKEDRIKLFDSIYRGFPIGDILLWDPETRREGQIRFGPFVPERKDANCLLIVDGQQRLATLFGCLLLPEQQPEGGFPEWQFAFDTDNKEIVEYPGPSAQQPELLPLPVAIDTSKYLKWTRNLPAEKWDERTQAGDDFSKALRTYKVPFYVVRTQDRKLLEEVFERVNNTGKTLKRRDVFNALFPGTSGEDEPRIRLEDIAKRLESKNFGPIKDDWLVQALKPMVGMDPAANFSAQLRLMDEKDRANQEAGRTRETLSTIHTQLENATGAAIDFLKQVGIRHEATLPYVLVFPPLVHFFYRFTDPISLETMANLKSFVWFASVTGARQRHRSTFQRKAATWTNDARTAEVASEKLVDVAKADVGELPRGKTFVTHHDWSSGATRLVALALFELEPRDLVTEKPLMVWDYLLDNKGESPFRTLWSNNKDPWGISTANRLLGATDTPRSMGKWIEQAARQTTLSPTQSLSEEVLASQAITPEAWAALQKGNRLEFLDLREKRIAEVVDAFIKRQLG